MTKDKILVPVDFSQASQSAIDLARSLARVSSKDITLLHIQNGKSMSNSEDLLRSVVEKIKSEENFKIDSDILQGDIFTSIASKADPSYFNLAVIGTHGYKGLREKLLGADILKLLKNISIPVIAVQKDYKVPEHGIKSILFPTSTHETFDRKIKATVMLTQMFDAEVHLYTIEKPGSEISQKMKDNTQLAKQEFDKAGIKYIRIKEKQEAFSVGYSKQILTYVKKNNIDLIALITSPTRENYYFADSDKISLLTNDARIPVLCTSNKVGEDE